MKAEYTLKVKGIVDKEKLMSSLLDSGYIIATQKKSGNEWEISIYGQKEREPEVEDWIKEFKKIPLTPFEYSEPTITTLPYIVDKKKDGPFWEYQPHTFF